MNSHRIWIENGRPRAGPIYDTKTKFKLNYKLFIKNKKEMERSQISNSLHDALKSKNNNKFWKIWKNKFKSKNKNCCIIDSLSDEDEIASKFAKSFYENLNSFSSKCWETHEVFLKYYKNYGEEIIKHATIEVSLVDAAIKKLKQGKLQVLIT
jgi:hypothetical protein